MKILTKKKAEALFDDIMTLNLIASEAIRQQTMNEKPDISALLRTHEIVIERCANAAYTLKGMFGMALAYNIHKKYNEMRLKDLVEKKTKEHDKELKKHNLDVEE